MVKIEINGQVVEAHEGDMLIDVADQAEISIPRFCYHKKLSIVGSCRMCLVEVEGAWKPLPACATPVTDGMKVFTKSKKAIAAQKSVMEFLLINHPLDCPICDQGGECELQDVAMDYGDDVTRFSEPKRILGDRNVGSLIHTDMTRCIHCTRCVRFGQEIAGMMELGATGRSDQMEIGTYINQSISSELSGNMIDICPVGALTSKPFRYKVRAWELQSHTSISAHDSVGSNIILHVKDNQVFRTVPNENEAINEVWLSDKDRFAYEGVHSDDRLKHPMIKKSGQWQVVDWEEALAFTAEKIQSFEDKNKVGMLISPSSTLEEMALFKKIAQGLGVDNIDSRLNQLDFRLDKEGAYTPYLAHSLAEVEQLTSVFVIGSNLRKELPILNHRVRKAQQSGASVLSLNPVHFDLNMPHAIEMISTDYIQTLFEIAKAAGVDDAALKDIEMSEEAIQCVATLKESSKSAIFVGQVALTDINYSEIIKLASKIALATDSSISVLPMAANEVGAYLTGCVASKHSLNARQMIEKPLNGMINFGFEPEKDLSDGALALKAMQSADCVINFTMFDTEEQRDYADVMLPIGSYTETAGTFINLNKLKQSFRPAIKPVEEAKPGWKVLRVLGNLLNLSGFDYVNSNEVFAEVSGAYPTIPLSALELGSVMDNDIVTSYRLIPIYQTDGLVRRSVALQATPDATESSLHHD